MSTSWAPRGWVALAIVVLLTAMSGIGAVAQREVEPPWRTSPPAKLDEVSITVGSTELVVELAIRPEHQQLGLSYRNGLEPGRGMLFVYNEMDRRIFWMDGMRFCLDIVWIADGEIAGAVESVCPDPDGTEDADKATYVSDEPVGHVLEVPAGWLAAQGYGKGTAVIMPDSLAK